MPTTEGKDHLGAAAGEEISDRLTVALYAGDSWEHVCPVVRVVGPTQQAGLNLIKGSWWREGQIHTFPERVSPADIVVIQRDFPRYAELYDEVVARARDEGKAVIYELDDLLTELPHRHPDLRHYREARAAILQAVLEADAVTCATPGLRDYLRSFNANVRVLPNYLNDRLWKKALDTPPQAPQGGDGTNGEPVVIGYVGGHSHLSDLEMVKPALIEILRRYGDGVRLRFWGGPPPADLLASKNVEWLDPGMVDYAEFADYFSGQSCDVFIAPLQNGRFNRCKSSLKFLEYSASAVPGVFSRLTPYESVVTPEQDGFLASTGQEWVKHLSQLIESPSLRRRVGHAARQTLCEGWLLSDHAHQWADTYEEVRASTNGGAASHSSQVTRRLRRWHEELEAEIRDREGIVETLSTQLAEQERTSQRLSARLADREQLLETIASSPGWRLLQTVTPVRELLVPRNSRRERALGMAAHSLGVLKGEGFASFAQKVREGLQQARHDGTLPDVRGRAPFALTVQAGERAPMPTVSVVAPKGEGLPHLDGQALLDWVASQTYPGVEVVIWEVESGTAYPLDAPQDRREAPHVASSRPPTDALRRSLRGRYVCMASADLLQHPETYLETNLIALETEGLAFTINVYGNPDEVIELVKLSRLPGGEEFPLLRQVVRTDCLANDLSLDLSAWTHGGGAGVILGKLLVHTSNRTDAAGSLPFTTEELDAEMTLRERYVLGRPASANSPDEVTHVAHPVDTVLPASPRPSDKPTVLVALPFLAVGGVERVILDVMHQLRDEIRFVVVTVEEHDPALGTTADAFRQITPFVYTAPDYMLTPLNLSFMRYLFDRFNPQTLFIANGAGFLYDTLGVLKARYPEVRAVNQVYDHRVGWINRYDDELVAHLDAHIAVNERIREAYVQRGARPEQVHLIDNAIDTGEFDPDRYPQEKCRFVREKLRVPPEEKVVTFMARLHPQKRPMDFVELARRFSDDATITFLMVGDGPLGGAVNSEINRLGLENVVRHPFYRPSSDIFAISDVYVLPSEYEGMPLVVLEAQAMGKPVVVTDVGNNREMLDITGGGVIVPRIGDVSALKQGVEKMLDHPPDPHRTRQTVVTHFSLQQMAAGYRQALLGD